MEETSKNNETAQLGTAAVRRSFWCKLGFHSLKYVKQYRVTSKVKCSKCGREYIEGMSGELVRC